MQEQTSQTEPSELNTPSPQETADVAPVDLAAQLSDPSFWQAKLAEFIGWSREHLFTLDMSLQLSLMLAAFIPAYMFAPKLKQFINRQITEHMPDGFLRRLTSAFATISVPIALYLTVTIFIIALGAGGIETGFLEAMRSLILAWIVIRLVTLVIRSPFWSKVAFYTVWPIAALEVFGLLDNVTEQLDAMSVTLQPADPDTGTPAASLSLLDVVRAILIFAVFFVAANSLSKFLTRRLYDIKEINPSLRTLVGKILDLVLPILAIIIALQLVGFNLASLAIFSGAIGLGIGLGLQKVISNFAAGVTLLADKSIKPGDTIEVGDSYGWVTRMNTRYVAVRTRDGTEHLIPNDMLVNEGVINWSYGDRNVRVSVEYGVTYNIKDQEMVRKLGEDCAAEISRVLRSPPPRCNLVGFGDNSVNYELNFWINDPQNGLSNVRSDVMMAIWQALAEKDIEIPFPQRDVHIKSLPATGEMDSVKLAESPANATKAADLSGQT